MSKPHPKKRDTGAGRLSPLQALIKHPSFQTFHVTKSSSIRPVSIVSVLQFTLFPFVALMRDATYIPSMSNRYLSVMSVVPKLCVATPWGGGKNTGKSIDQKSM
jgi:hypothetical protein